MTASSTNIVKTIGDKNIIVFDGECVLCSGFFNFVLRQDTHRQFSFLTAQSTCGEALYAHYNLKAEDYDTNLVIIQGKLYERLHGFFKVMQLLGMPWRMMNIFRILPDPLLDWTYYRIARNRYRLFGKWDSCLVPDEKLRARFLD